VFAIGKTNIGKVREKNEDAFFVSNKPFYGLENIYIVADGMGGHNAGEVASKMSIQLFLEYVENSYELKIEKKEDVLNLLSSAISYANKNVYKESLEKEELAGMGTTFTCLTLCKGEVIIAHVGDTRAYIVTKTNISQLTNDHTYINEILSLAEISKDDAMSHPKRNMLTRALGTDIDINIDTYVVTINKNDKLLICSDGLTNMVKSDEIFNIINECEELESSVNALINISNYNGGVDNITVILTEVTEVCL
jgi:PPM family protein phosphatase